MATALDTITRAMRMIQATGSGETPTNEEAADGLVVLNDMLHGWAKMGVDLGHISLALADTHKTHDSYLQGIRANLAVLLANEYGRPIPQWIARLADKTFSAFQAHTLEFPDDLAVDRALQPRYFSGRNSGAYDIDQG